MQGFKASRLPLNQDCRGLLFESRHYWLVRQQAAQFMRLPQLPAASAGKSMPRRTCMLPDRHARLELSRLLALGG